MIDRIYEYRRVRVKPNRWDDAAGIIKSEGAAAIDKAGGHFYGLWINQIGESVNEGLIMTDWPDVSLAEENGRLSIAASSHVIESTTELLQATSVPETNTPPEKGGICSRRWFEVRKDQWQEFLDLSQRSWPGWESTFKTKPFGLWKSRTVIGDDIYRVLLMCRYEDLHHWESSRWWADTTDPAVAEALALQKRRREITLDTYVCMMRML